MNVNDTVKTGHFLTEAASWRLVADMARTVGYGGLCTCIIVARNHRNISRDVQRAMFRKIKAEGRRVKGPGYSMDDDYVWKPYTASKRSARYRWAIAQAEKLEDSQV